MRISSVNKTAWIEIDKKKGEEDFTVEIQDRGLIAKTLVYGYMSQDLPDLFLFMKKNWQGWEGTRSWGSIEGQFKIDATMDKLGHITLKVFLTPDLYDGWEVECEIYLEPSQLDALHEEVKDIFSPD